MFEAVSRKIPLRFLSSLFHQVEVAPITRPVLGAAEVKRESIKVGQERYSELGSQPQVVQRTCFATPFAWRAHNISASTGAMQGMHYWWGKCAFASSATSLGAAGHEVPMGVNMQPAANELDCDILASWVYRALYNQLMRVTQSCSTPSLSTIRFVNEISTYHDAIMAEIGIAFSEASKKGALSEEQSADILVKVLRENSISFAKEIALPGSDSKFMLCTITAYNIGVIRLFAANLSEGLEKVCEEHFLSLGVENYDGVRYR
jgi:hypothetical protein